MDNQKIIIIVSAVFMFVVVMLLTLLGVFLYTSYGNEPPVVIPVTTRTPKTPTPPPAPDNTSVGAVIYQQSKNPIQNKIPESDNPAVNPIEGIYKNPF